MMNSLRLQKLFTKKERYLSTRSTLSWTWLILAWVITPQAVKTSFKDVSFGTLKSSADGLTVVDLVTTRLNQLHSHYFVRHNCYTNNLKETIRVRRK